MRKVQGIWWLVFVFLLPSVAESHRDLPRRKSFPFTFVENKGQWDQPIRYKVSLPYGALFLEDNTLTFAFLDEKSVSNLLEFKFLTPKQKTKALPLNPYVPAHSYKVRFEGAKQHPGLRSSHAYPEYQNYYLGNDRSRWATEVRQYQEVIYQDLYEGIDMQIRQEDGNLKYNFLIARGSDPRQIRLQFEGAERLRLKKGGLQVFTTVNCVEELAPLAWQEDEKGQKQEVRCEFILKNSTVSFYFPDGYDTGKNLVLDPVLVFSTYSGSPVDNWGYTATYDKDGFLYAGGSSFTIGYPVSTGAYQVNYGGGSADMVISKYDTTGSFMIYSTYLGGSGTEVPTSLIVNNNNELLVLGTTGSGDFPVTSLSYDPIFNGGTPYTLTFLLQFPNGSDLVISRLSSDGTSMISSTYFGGSGNDGLNAFAPLKHNYADDARGEIKIDNGQNIYVVTSTQSTDLPVTAGAFQTVFGGEQDACIVKFDPSLTYSLWCSYLGGSTADAGYSLTLNDDGRVYVAGGTTSDDFPVTAQPFQNSFQGGGSDGFISCLVDNGQSLMYSTYYGSSAYDQIYFIDEDKLGNIYVLGQTAASGSFYISNVSWSLPGGGQFISKFLPDLFTRVYSTAFGTGNGGPDISPTAFLVDYCNYVYVSGWGSHNLNNFGGTAGLPITSNAFQTTTDDNDYYFMVMTGDASGLIYGSFFGGSAAEHVDGGTSRFDKKGRIYQSVCAGCGGISDFPTTPGALSTVNGSTNCNNAVIKYDFKIPLAIADFIHPPSGCAPYTVNFQNTSYTAHLQNAHYFWDFGDGNNSTLSDPVHTFQQPGFYNVTLILSDTFSCNLADTLTQMVLVLGGPTTNLPGRYICAGESVQIGTLPIPDPSLTYQWFPATGLSNAFLPNPMASPIQSTTYNLLISNGLCADTLKQFVRVYDLAAEAGNDTILCSGSVLLTASANEDSLYFQWSSNAQFSDTLNNPLSDSTALVSLMSQMAWFYIRVFNDYCDAIDSVKVSFSILVSPGNGRDPLCPDSCDGIAVVHVTGGNPPFQYLWSTGQTLDSLSHLCAGVYTVTITDSIDCVSIASITLTDPPELITAISVTNVPCDEICNGQTGVIVSGGTSPYTYLWNNGSTSPALTDLCKGNYLLTVTDDHGCPAYDQTQVVVETIFQNIHVTTDPDTIYQGQTAQLQATELPGVSYSWSPSLSLNDASSSHPTATPSTTTLYFVTLTDPFGCQYADSVKVFVKEVNCREPYIYIPNAFSPNGDNNNDVFLVQSKMVETLKLSVYDRWGNRVFETRNPAEGWNGNWKGDECEPGVYVYHLEAGCFNKETFKKKGNITLIR